MKKPILTIQDWDSGIADDPYQGFQMVKNLNDNMPGIASCGFYLSNATFRQDNITFTAHAGTDIVTTASDYVGCNPYRSGIAVTFTTTGTLPVGLSTNTTYFTAWLSNTTFKVATSLANLDSFTYVDITNSGSGVHTVVFTKMGYVSEIVQDTIRGYWYAVDSNGKVWSTAYESPRWRLLDGNTTTSGNGNGITIWKDYLLVFRNQKIDTYGPLSAALGSRAWTNDWQNSGTGSLMGDHAAIASINDKVYWINGNTIGSLNENAGQIFAPGTGATFTLTTNALDLPDGFVASCLEDYGSYLAIGANKGKSSVIFPWDRTSSSFNSPVEIPETTVSKLVSLNNILYVITNSKAAVYATNLSSVTRVKRLPLHLTAGIYIPNMIISINSVTKIGGKLYLGVSAALSGTSTENTGIYSLDPSTGVIKLVNTLVVRAGVFNQKVGAIGQMGQYSDGTPYYFCFSYDSTTPNSSYIDTMTINQYPYTNYEPQIVSPFYQVSTDPFEATPITRAVFHLQIPLTSVDGIKLEYREYDTQAWTELGTFTGATQKADQKPMVDMEFHAYVTQVQFRISLKSTNSSGETFVRLKKVDIF